MTWTKEHDVMLCREMLVIQPFRFKHGTRDRGRCWEKIAQNVNDIAHLNFIVDIRGVRDRFGKLEKNFKKKRATEERESGICPDEPDELDQALEEIVQLMNEEQWDNGERRKEIEKEKETAASVRKRAMERLAETRAREGVEREGRKRRCGTEAVEYLKERREHDDTLKEEEIELRNREINLKEKSEEAERRMKERKLDMKEREVCMKERELEARLKRDEDIIYIMKQQLQQQQGLLEEVQQQNKLLLSLYQKSLEKK